MSEVYTWEPSNAAIAARYGLDPADILRFDTNTSPQAPSFAAGILGGSFDPPLNEYPDSAYGGLAAAAAAYLAAPSEEIIVGAGADELLDLAAKAFLTSGGAALLPVPTYGMYGVLTSQRGARLTAVPRRGPEEGFALDREAIIARLPDVQLVWLCDPNNPTGRSEDPATLEAILDAAARLGSQGPLILVDEAYHEFAGTSVAGWRDRYERLLVLRTLSKAFGLAGVRVGYGVAARPTIARLERVRPPGSVSTISATLGAAALARPELALANVARLVEERERLAAGLAACGWQPYPSVTNFLLVRVGDGSVAAAEAAADGLLRAGIVPRTFGPANPLRGHLRLTVRDPASDDRLLAALAALAGLPTVAGRAGQGRP
ncbi:MAG: histidinol-phosphate aminotransferase family protein [Chloroflexota bacterium]|nr:MAG: histidinol-phosphate aminotransferase family protein [Chloroflexota bacterium]